LCRSEEWNKVPKKERDKLGLKVEDDGEFWLVHSHTQQCAHEKLDVPPIKPNHILST
jgi:imidazoleglycerol phosphate synthase glutamine amidotransferase subunit HisH